MLYAAAPPRRAPNVGRLLQMPSGTFPQAQHGVEPFLPALWARARGHPRLFPIAEYLGVARLGVGTARLAQCAQRPRWRYHLQSPRATSLRRGTFPFE